MKRIFIVHGWDGYPEEGWFPWLRRELEARGFEVHVPQLPEPGSPRMKNWVPALAKAVGTADEQTFFVGHSMGCQTIARYLASLPEGVQVGGAVFVAGFFKRLTNLEDDEEVREIASEWLTTPLNLADVFSHLRKSVAIFSDNDPFVPMENQEDFRDQLQSKIIIEHNMGHFSGRRDNVLELPVVLEAVVSLVET
ncbi:MAG: alpha/beta fold hydrolase [Patescibacteria group bacterium]